ncbi:MAG: hypothetical protein HXY37_02050 [Chloroflexi bacterium]|nr:hypothetical protein [Chloroflexota bacterium]
MLFCVGLTLVIAGGIGGGREATAQPQPPAAAGLLVELDDGSVVSACVALDNPFGITAAELLERSGLGVQIGAYDYGSRAVCQLAGTGCDIAQGEPCFCALDDDPTASRMWLDYRQDAGGWQAAWPRFIDRRRVLPGEVEAWVWGSPGDANGVGTDRPTSPLTFEQICAELLPTATATATPTATTTATTMPTDTATTEPLPATSTTGVEAPPAQPSPIIFPVPSATPRPTPSVAPTPTPSATPQLARSPTSAPTIEPAAQGEQIRIFLPLVAGVPEQSLGSSVAVTPPATPAPTVGPTASATPDLTMTAASAARATEAILQTEFALAPVAAAPPNTSATWVRRTPTAALDLPTDRPITQYPL